ncbi:MAG: TlyA family RNA methyltransferase [Rhodocyclaceae bacterium]|nr:TlyA family RNA methyltransferase [Rhodocyclaceae bacterium]
MSMNSFHARKSRAAPVREAPARIPRRGMRADALLVDMGLAPSRTAAQRLIEAERVTGPAGLIAKPSQELPLGTELSVLPDEAGRYVSRGGLKLAGALRTTGVSVEGKCCLDLGQSTGGFTDCLLQAGANRVVGVDVGHGQLHPDIAALPKVMALEGINCRSLAASDLGSAMPEGGFDVIVGDLSFISLTLILPQLPALLAPDGDLLLLVKPQFEVGPGGLAKGGVVRDPALYAEVEKKLRQASEDCGLEVVDWLESPIAGGGVGNIPGNREFFIWNRHGH